MSLPTQLTVKPKRNMLVVGFRSPRIQDDAIIATIGRELIDVCDLALSCERRILLNFQGVRFLSSALIGKIVLLHKKAKAARITIRLCNIAPEIVDIFVITRLNKVFPIVDYLEDDDGGPEALGCRVPSPPSPYCNAASVERRPEDGVESAGERDGLRFAPELFRVRADVIACLSDQGFDWLSHYSSVDPLHDVYGIEVCGIHRREDAIEILGILVEMFPDWKPG